MPGWISLRISVRISVRISLRIALVGIVAVLALTSCSDDTQGASDEDVLDLNDAVGTCLLVGDEIGAEVSTLPVIDCVEDHTHEIFGRIELSDEEYPVYPGSADLTARAEGECASEFEIYVGSSPFDADAELFYTWILPTLDGWNEHGDRVILCVASRRDGAPMVGSIAAAP